MTTEKVNPDVESTTITVPGTDHLPLSEFAVSALEPSPNDHDEQIVPMWRQRARIFMHNKLAIASVVYLVLITLFCFLWPHIHPTNQTNQNLALLSPFDAPPSAAHPLGTDSSGFDVLGRIAFGGEYSLTLGFLAGFITIVVGTVYGMIAGFFGGFVDTVMMRFLDAVLSVPYIFLLITMITLFSRSTTFLILLIGLTGWWGNARIIRGDALLIRRLEYTQAATAMGASKWHIIRRHVFPNSISNIVTVATFSVADAILFLSALGFLGLGIEPPQTDWGTMLQNGADQISNGFWWEVYPLAIVFILVVVSINYIGDALRDSFEVRLIER